MIRINGARLKRWREEAGHKQETLAEAVRTSDRTIRTAETQGRISKELAEAICKVLKKGRSDLERLTPDLRVELLDGRSREQADLFKSGLLCHKRLFTGYFADVSREYMEDWLVEGFLHDYWREIYAVAYEDHPSARNVVGLASLSGHLKWEFWYCTRLGVLPEWRSGLVAEKLLFEAIKSRSKELLPNTHTFIWEVEAPDMLLLAELRHHLAQGRKLKQWPDRPRMLQALRSARRLKLFERLHSLTATTPSGSPLTITSPAWRAPLDTSNEREMMLFMLMPPLDGNSPRSHPTVDRTLDFLYAVLYGDSFGGEATLVHIENYRPYVKALLVRMKKKAAGCRWNQVPRFDDLITQAKAEGLWDDIELIEAEK